jgi:hypothetical protein
MTKKDYRAIGHAIRCFTEAHSQPVPSLWLDFSKVLAGVFERDNPKFDRARFLRFVETGKDTRSWGDD